MAIEVKFVRLTATFTDSNINYMLGAYYRDGWRVVVFHKDDGEYAFVLERIVEVKQQA